MSEQPKKILTLAGVPIETGELAEDSSGDPIDVGIPLNPISIAAAIQQLQLLGGFEPAKSEPSVTTAKAIQDVTGKWSTWYVPVAAEKTLTVEFGPTEAEVNKVKLAYEAAAASKLVAEFRLPPGWWAKLTATSLGQPVVVTG